MSTNDIGFNYASAFIEALGTEEEIRAGAADLAGFEALADEVPALTRVLDHPGQPMERRKALLDDLLDRLGAHAKTRRLMHLIVQNGRMRELRAIRAAFNQLRDKRMRSRRSSASRSRGMSARSMSPRSARSYRSATASRESTGSRSAWQES